VSWSASRATLHRSLVWMQSREAYIARCTRLHLKMEEKACQPDTKLGAIAQTRHIARLRNAKRSRTKHPTRGARDRPKQPQPSAGRDRALGLPR
jgi:hypothetical protein